MRFETATMDTHPERKDSNKITPSAPTTRPRKRSAAIKPVNYLSQLVSLFDYLKDGSGLIGYPKFIEFITTNLKLNYSEAEIDRLWSVITSTDDSKADARDSKLDFEQFEQQSKKWVWLRNIVSSYDVTAALQFQVAPGYDYSKSTNDNYSTPDAEFAGKYKGACVSNASHHTKHEKYGLGE